MAIVEPFHRRNDAANPPEQVDTFRVAPHNVEAEQALLGAILVNNDAYDRVSDFLQPLHFSEEIHRRIFEVAASLIRGGKIATPVTLKTFLGEHDLGGITLPQYMARLAAEATTVINAGDYGRLIYDLALRRNLISIGEEMVNVAYDAPVDHPPRLQIEDAERRLYEVAETGRSDAGFQRFSDALTTAIDVAAKAYERDGKLSGISTGMVDLDRQLGGLQSSDLVVLAGRPAMGKTALATNIAFNIAKAYQFEVRPDGTHATTNGGIVGFFSLEMSAEQLATRIIAEQSGVASYRIRRGDISESDFHSITDAARDMQTVPFYIDQTGGISIAQLTARARRSEAPARPRPPGHRLPAAAVGVEGRPDQQGAGTHRDHHRPQSPRQGAGRAGAGPLAIVSPGRKPRGQAAAIVGPARIGVDRAGRGRRHVRLSRGILPQEPPATRRHGRVHGLALRQRARARQGGGHHRQAAARADRHGGAAIRCGGHPLLDPRPRGYFAGADVSSKDSTAVLTIDLDAIGHNWRHLAARAAPAECGAAVKADGYGCGIEAVVPALARAGCRTFFTAHASEGRLARLALRDAGQAGRIFVLNGYHPEAAGFDLYRDFELSAVIGSAEELAAWAAAVGPAGPGLRAALHVDTGMNRLGFPVEEARLLSPQALQAARIEVVMTHLVSAERPADPINARQIAAFDHALERALKALPSSLANSSGMFLPQRPMRDLVRPGYALYGGNPTPGQPNPMRAVVGLTARILQLRRVPAGTSVGYNGRWTADRPTRLATLGIGYADGLSIGASGIEGRGAQVVVGDRPCPILGRISMDLTIVDVTDASPGLEAGAMVEVLGPHVGVDDLGQAAGTIGYEILTSLGRRHLRHYIGDGTATD